ncbi:MAG: type II 3-dehydroquinate dehydratase [Cyclobacteriaceae bacterium]|nr:type II 3-dehydroquinate dehydratase [Cyclobacteriaceae bacterium]
MNIIIINGPNLNLLGKREKGIYGETKFDSFFAELKSGYPAVDLHYFQSNSEGAIIDKIHETGFSFDGIIINAGAFTHTSLAIRDAIAGVETQAVEVHISNIFQRETFRHLSYIAPVCLGSISGFGLESYRLALEYFLHKK